MQLKVAQVVGLNTDQKAAQVLSIISDKDNAFFALLTLECDDAFTRGRQTLSELSDLYFEGNSSQKLSEVLKALQEKLKDVSNFDFILASLSGKVLYLLGKGNVEVYLKRDGKTSQLLSVGPPTDLISGLLQPEDRVLFATKNLTAFLADDLLSALVLPLESFEEEISNRILGGSFEENGLSGLLIEVKQDQDKVNIPQLSEEASEAQITSESASNLPKKVNLEKIVQNSKGGIIWAVVHIKKFIPKTNKGRLILAVILIIIIFAGAFLQFQSSQNKQKEEQFNQLLQSAKSDFEAAKGLASLNPSEAKTKLDSAKDNINKALSIKPKDSQALEFKNQLEGESSSILQQFTATGFPLFLDLDLIKKGFSAQSMSLSGKQLLLLDASSKTLVALDLDKKSNQVLAGESQLGQAEIASLNGSLGFVYSEDKGIVRIDLTNQKEATVAKADEEWGKIVDISGFASNVYLLDTLKGQIWKYLPVRNASQSDAGGSTQDGYSDKREYLTAPFDLANSIRMQIESSIYVLQRDGAMLRFTRGAKDHFSYGGLDKGVLNPKSFFVSSDTDNLYLLDSGNSRLLILTKTGEYKGQINGDKFAQVSDLVVDEKEKKVYLLEGSKIYTVDLR